MHDFCPNEDNTGVVRVTKLNNEHKHRKLQMKESRRV